MSQEHLDTFPHFIVRESLARNALYYLIYSSTASFSTNFPDCIFDHPDYIAFFLGYPCRYLVDIEVSGLCIVRDLAQTGINYAYHTLCIPGFNLIREPDPGACFSSPDKRFKLPGGYRYRFVWFRNPPEA